MERKIKKYLFWLLFFITFVSFANAAPTLLHVKQNGDEFVFTFNEVIAKSAVKQFSMANKTSNRYIYDIKASRANTFKEPVATGISRLRIAQFDKTTVRIVFEDSKKQTITYAIKDKTITFKVKGLIATSNVATTPSPVVIKKNKIVVIDAGHGGKDAGAVYGKLYEKNAVLQISLLLGEELKRKGYTVFYTRTKDVYLQLRDRTKVANDKNADLFISVHANAAPKKAEYNSWEGIETFFLSPARSDRSKSVAELENKSDLDEMDFYSKQTFLNFLNREKIIASHKLAIDVQQFSLTSVKTKYKQVSDGGVREAPFWVLVGAQMPAVLLEVGYITHAGDRERMFNKEFQKLLADGIATGIDAYFLKNQ
ncbi:MAG: N-acetylmuramoyl-L-alanine amidase [Campylobacteraceae bacterium]